MTRSLVLSCITLAAAAAASQAQTYVPIGTVNGGIATYFNPAVEAPANTSYFRAQFANSTTNVNGAAFSWAPPLNAPAFFNDLGQFGFDMILAAPTNTGVVPTLQAYDNTDNNPANAAPVGAPGDYAWLLNNYTTSAGPSDPANPVIHSHIRGTGVTASVGTPVAIPGGFEVSFSGTLQSDGFFRWYNPAFTDSNFNTFIVAPGQYWSGNFRFGGTLTYLTADDSTPGMDFYAGTVLIEAEIIPAPSALAVLGLGGLVASRRRR